MNNNVICLNRVNFITLSNTAERISQNTITYYIYMCVHASNFKYHIQNALGRNKRVDFKTGAISINSF